MKVVFGPYLAVLLIQLLLQLAYAQGPNCNIPLNSPSGVYGCIAQCLGQQHTSANSFVCDISAEWMHHVGGTDDWYPETPPKSTGIHEYVAYTGTPPCDANGHCTGCDKQQIKGAKKLCSVLIDPEDCSVRCTESAGATSSILLAILILGCGAAFYFWKVNSKKKTSHAS